MAAIEMRKSKRMDLAQDTKDSSVRDAGLTHAIHPRANPCNPVARLVPPREWAMFLKLKPQGYYGEVRTSVLSSLHRARRAGSLDRSGTGTRSRGNAWGRRGATVVAAALAMGMAYGVVFGHNGLTAFAKKRQEEQTLRLQMQQLQRDNARLEGHVQRLQNDPSAIEHQAREELHYTRSGEVIYTLPAAPAPKTYSVPNE